MLTADEATVLTFLRWAGVTRGAVFDPRRHWSAERDGRYLAAVESLVRRRLLRQLSGSRLIVLQRAFDELEIYDRGLTGEAS